MFGTREFLKNNYLYRMAAAFWTVLRLYWPKSEATEGKWSAPPMKRGA
jgi:hypothetical protein